MKKSKPSARRSRKEEYVVLDGPLFEAQRVLLTRSPHFNKSFYAFALTHHTARLDGKDEIAIHTGSAAANIRKRVMAAWQKMGHVIIEYEGEPRLGAVITE